MKTEIENRQGQKIVVQIENETGKAGLVFIVHGLSGNKEQLHIQVYAESFIENDYVVVLWDSTNTLGESDGKLEDATLTNYFLDMEDVVEWSESQDWYSEPFVVAGHSLGGACNILYATKYPDKVKALAPTSAFLSWNAYKDSLESGTLESWKKNGYKEEESQSKPGLIKRYNWTLAENLQKYELFAKAREIDVPVLLVVGSDDDGTPPSSQERFLQNLPDDNGSLYIIHGAGHKFTQEKHLNEIKEIMSDWIQQL